MILKILSKLFGNKYEIDLKAISPVVDQVKSAEEALKSLSMDALRGKTLELKDRLHRKTADLKSEIHQLTEEAVSLSGIAKKQSIYEEVDRCQKEVRGILDAELDRILPEAFAIVRETARRFCDFETLSVEATPYDEELARGGGHVTVENGKAFWQTSWSVSGNKMLWDMVHYDVQLIGGTVLHQGKIAEMATGEGKTLVSTLPIYLNALSGGGVHVITVNDYLARRDAQWMKPILQIHGFTVDCIEDHRPGSLSRKKAYEADVTYGTNSEFGFDYLRDNMSHNVDELVQPKKLNYAIIDEVDSVLVDDARTPLIISGQVDENKSHHKQYLSLRSVVEQLVSLQKSVVMQCLTDAKKHIQGGDLKASGFKMFQAHRGLPKNKVLIKLLSDTGNKERLQKTENIYLQDNAKRMPEVDEDLYFVIDEKQNNIDLTERGIAAISTSDDQEFFVIPDTSLEIGAIEKSGLSAEEKNKKKQVFFEELQQKSLRIHTINQLLRAYTLFEKDSEYVVMEGKVKIVDEQTGRIMDGRRYSDGLHQAIEAKENVNIEASSQTLATITLQNYFRMYNKMSGMTGTAETEAREFWEIYKMDVVVIPTNKPIVRDDRHDFVYRSVREKMNAIIQEIDRIRKSGRPTLVGTTSVETSELISRMLKMRRVPHNVLNAKLHKKEADIVAQAGRKEMVTIATNMAGRGTDIKLSPEVIASGGLAIIGTERHDSRRVDRQLRGRSGRQGDMGSSQFFVSLEDHLMRVFGQGRMARVMDRIGLKEGEVIQHSLISKSIERAQKKVEENNFGVRKRLLEYDDVMNAQRKIIYEKRRHALYGERINLDIANMFADTIEDVLRSYQKTNDYPALEFDFIRVFGYMPSVDKIKVEDDPLSMVMDIFQIVWERYTQNKEKIKSDIQGFLQGKEVQGEAVKFLIIPLTDGQKVFYTPVPYSPTAPLNLGDLIQDAEKKVVLSHVDAMWKDHLKDMDDLRQSVQGAVYEQKDPLLLYKIEALELFKSMMIQLDREVATFLTKSFFPMHIELLQQKRSDRESSVDYTESRSMDKPMERKVIKSAPARSQKISRNSLVTIRNTSTGAVQTLKYKNVTALLDSGDWERVDATDQKKEL